MFSSNQGRPCQLCASNNQAEFGTKMIIHFSGLNNVDKPGVWVFPKLSVCLDCGFSQFTVPESAVSQLAQAAPTREPSTEERETSANAT
jgi:hypothetical protein